MVLTIEWDIYGKEKKIKNILCIKIKYHEFSLILGQACMRQKKLLYAEIKQKN